ncbi:MAG: hypothetical protein IJ485_06405 [Lachnospiraceae bacterium]|nr:hypothetical protein [Lachnospiraceae bacterium]
MSIQQRVLACRLLEKMQEQKTYSKKLGLEDFSTFQGMQIDYNMKCHVERAREL